MNIHIRSLSEVHVECWIETWNQTHGDWEVVAECKVLNSGDLFLVDEIFTKPGHRRNGYARKIVEKLQSIKKVLPIGVSNTPEAQAFWESLGLKDALGTNPDYEKFLIENNQFDLKIVS